MSLRKLSIVGVLLTVGAGVSGAGCSAAEDLKKTQEALCCKDFEVGADLTNVDWEVKGEGSAKFSAFMVAAADFAAAAQAVVVDVSGACQSLAIDLGAKENEVQETAPDLRAAAWCNLAVAKIESQVKAKGSVTVKAQPPSCSFSASAQASCEAKCSGKASCEVSGGDVTARCDPGFLSVKCGGQCAAKCEGSANVAVACTGKCEGACEGKCDGMAMGASASGQCAGTCEGTCRGTCDVSGKASVKCDGECTGGCTCPDGTDSCKKAPRCKAELTPPSAECRGDVDCSSSCKASASAKADCKEGSVTISATGSIDADALASLQANLPKIVAVVKARGAYLQANAQALVEASVGLKAAAPNLSVKAAACIVPAFEAVSTAAKNATAGGTASVKVTASVGI